MTGDVVIPADEATARRLDSRIRLMAGTMREGLEKIAALVEQAKAGQIHLTLGFPSWTAYLADALGGKLAVDATTRQELVAFLSREGMSNRAIASATGVNEITVRRDKGKAEVRHNVAPAKVTGLDGKSHPAKKAAPAKKAPAKKTALKLVKDPERTTPKPVDLDVKTEVKEMVKQFDKVVDKIGGSAIMPTLVTIAAQLSEIADFVKALDHDAKIKFLADHIDAFNEIGKQHRRTTTVLNAADRKRRKDNAAKAAASTETDVAATMSAALKGKGLFQ